jgi:hypothetical protein
MVLQKCRSRAGGKDVTSLQPTLSTSTALLFLLSMSCHSCALFICAPKEGDGRLCFSYSSFSSSVSVLAAAFVPLVQFVCCTRGSGWQSALAERGTRGNWLVCLAEPEVSLDFCLAALDSLPRGTELSSFWPRSANGPQNSPWQSTLYFPYSSFFSTNNHNLTDRTPNPKPHTSNAMGMVRRADSPLRSFFVLLL